MSEDSAEQNHPLDDERLGGNNDDLEQIEVQEQVQVEQVSPLEAAFLNIATINTDMLRFIAEGCSFEDLRNFRLASKSFYNLSLKAWRRKAMPRLDFGCDCPERVASPNRMNSMFTLNEATRFVVELEVEERNDESRFLQIQAQPYRAINIHGWSCPTHDDGIGPSVSILPFFSRMNPLLNHIVLESFDSNDSFRILQYLKDATNLNSVVFKNCEAPRWVDDRETLMAKHLTIDPLPSQRRVWLGVDKFFFMILKNFPNLQTLTLRLTSLVTSTNCSFLKCLEYYNCRTGNDSLRFKICGIADFEGTISEFYESQIPLEVWTVKHIGSDFEDKLCIGSPKLVKLTVDKDSDDESDTTDFPFYEEFPVLRELYLFGNVTTSFNFLQYMPALEKVVVRMYEHLQLLIINFYPREMRKDDFVRNTPIPKKFDEIQNLTYLDIDCYLDLDGLAVLYQTAPKLSVLRTALRNNEMFQFVCEKWELLTHLALYPGSAVDDIEIPKLTTLKHLTSFKIWNSTDRELTDASVHDGFLKMNKLNKLGIYCLDKISEQCKELLRTGIRKVKFSEGRPVPDKHAYKVLD